MFFQRIKLILVFLAYTAFGTYLIFTASQEMFHGNVLDYIKFKQTIINKKISTVYLLDNKSWFFEWRGPRRSRIRRDIQWESLIESKKDLEDFCKEHNIRLIINPSVFDIYVGKISSFMRFLIGIFFLIAGIMCFVSLIYPKNMKS